MEKVSVIIPVYNAEKFLYDCLESVRKQTYRNIEVIMINDGSTDSSGSICRFFCETDSRFKLLDRDNEGVCSARNLGIKMSLGNLISFVDADDTIEEHFIQSLYEKLKNGDADIAQCNFAVNKVKEFKDWTDQTFMGNEIMSAFLNGKISNRIMNKLFVRSVVQDVLFPKERNIKEDAYWMAKVLDRSRKFISVSEAMYNYRIVENSLSHNKVSEFEECGRYRNDLEKFLIIKPKLASKRDIELLDKLVHGLIQESLLSFDDLRIHNVYDIIRKHIKGDKSASILEEIVLENTDYWNAQSQNFKFILLSGKISLERKIRCIYRIWKRRKSVFAKNR